MVGISLVATAGGQLPELVATVMGAKPNGAG